MKAEFLQGYYDVHGVPARAKRIANFTSNMKLASKAPWMFNFLVSNFATRSVCLLYTFRAHETREDLVCRLLLEKKNI